MREIWLRPNRRALLAGLFLPLALLIVGLLLVGLPALADSWLVRAGGAVLLAVALLAVTVVLAFLRTPRLAYEAGELLVYLRFPQPYRVPIENVECFFLGHAPSLLPVPDRTTPPARALIVRIADAARDWHARDVKVALGTWSDGAITIRGTWCEPLLPTVVSRLNKRLIELQRERRAAAEGPVP